MKIQKSTFIVTVLHDDGNSPLGLSMEALATEMSEGSMIGQMIYHGTSDVHPKSVAQELLEVNNDGSFFDFLGD